MDTGGTYPRYVCPLDIVVWKAEKRHAIYGDSAYGRHEYIHPKLEGKRVGKMVRTRT